MILSGNVILNEKQEIFLLSRNNCLETPGGKVEAKNCIIPLKPSLSELEDEATRELYEEVSGIVKIKKTQYLGAYEFVTLKGVKAIAHKFLRIVSGDLKANEDIFDKEKSRYYSVSEIEKESVVPDFPHFLEILKKDFHV